MNYKELKKDLIAAVKRLYKIDLDIKSVVADENPKQGDVSFNVAFKFTESIRKPAKEIAEEIAHEIKNVGYQVEAAAGFINIFLEPEYLLKELQALIKKEDPVSVAIEGITGKKIQVEFISANPTGPLTLGNGRGGFGGDALARLFEAAGAKVQREYLVNDGGNQVRVLGDSILIAAGKKEPEGEYYKGEYVQEWIAKNSKKIKPDSDSFELGQQAASDVLENLIKPSVKKLGINFDQYFHEKELIARGEVKKALSRFKKEGIAEEKEGALWFLTSQTSFKDEDRVLIKSNGDKTYFANDTAYHWDKFATRKFDKVINIWGADHHGYVSRMLAAVEAMGFGGKLEIVITQLVRLIKGGEEFKMSKRRGTYVTMDDLLELISGKKSPQPEEIRQAADVARFFFLSRAFNTHMDFDLDLAREHSEKNPVFYVKYAYARMSGILEKAKNLNLESPNLALIKDKAELELIKELVKAPSVVKNILTSKDYPVHILTFYVRDIATKFHSFYDKCRVIDEESLELTAARLELVRATQKTLKAVMEELIGIEAPEKM